MMVALRIMSGHGTWSNSDFQVDRQRDVGGRGGRCIGAEKCGADAHSKHRQRSLEPNAPNAQTPACVMTSFHVPGWGAREMLAKAFADGSRDWRGRISNRVRMVTLMP